MSLDQEYWILRPRRSEMRNSARNCVTSWCLTGKSTNESRMPFFMSNEKGASRILFICSSNIGWKTAVSSLAFAIIMISHKLAIMRCTCCIATMNLLLFQRQMQGELLSEAYLLHDLENHLYDRSRRSGAYPGRQVPRRRGQSA